MEMLENGEGGTLLESAHSHSDDDDDDSETSSEDPDLTLELRKTFPECYKTDINSKSRGNLNEELQASALCQFMDILNDLDDVLDKSLLACVDEAAATLEDYLDEEDVICRGEESASTSSALDSSMTQQVSPSGSKEFRDEHSPLGSAEFQEDGADFQYKLKANRQDAYPIGSTDIPTEESNTQSIEENRIAMEQDRLTEMENLPQIIMPKNRIEVLGISPDDELRSSMRRLDPIVMPTLADHGEPLTLPVILFLEHHVNMRPSSAPIQLQVRAANVNVSADGPLMLGRRTLVMNRTLSLPSPVDSEDRADATSYSRTARSTSSSSTESTESLDQQTLNVPPQTTLSAERNADSEEDDTETWPHRLSSTLACLSCTVGLFNISRFAIFSVHFGANFIIQFFILSLILGIPLLTLQLCLGQILSSGPMDMWRISPIFQGVGVAILASQIMMGVYSIVGVSWIFVYFRDSFITAKDSYRWSLPLDFFGEEPLNKVNHTYNLQETLPQYFNGEVLQRSGSVRNTLGTIKFQVAFNLAVVWMIVFVCLSKGLRSYGKAVYALMSLPVCGTLVLCTKLLTLIPHDSVSNVFSETEWSEFFINSNSWSAAAQETFLTWGLLGACVMQLTSHKNAKNKTDSMLQKESACVVAFTFAILLLAAFLANTCAQILKNYGYTYIPSSYETVSSSQFLYKLSEPLPGILGSTPVRYMGHYGNLVGITVWRVGGEAHTHSGWQPLQLATQLVPATLAVLTSQQLSPVWAVIFYFILIMFGIAQQLAIWHCVITGIVNINAEVLRAWETTITFLSCVCGLLLGLLFTTDAGVRIIHWLDYVAVGMWWQCLLYVVLICGVFLVRGRPYSGDTIVTALYSSTGSKCSIALASLLSLTWNLTAPVVMCALCVVDFRVGRQKQLYSWRRNSSAYWPVWARQLGAATQLTVLLLVPVAAFVQTWRYMSKGPPDILERIQNLYRPRLGDEAETRPPAGDTERPARASAAAASVAAPAPADPPPKYTPPPSYSTATGARLLNTIRRSFRTLRRITSSLGEASFRSDTAPLSITVSEIVERPPEYINPPSIVVTDETDRTHDIYAISHDVHVATNDINDRSNDINGRTNDINITDAAGRNSLSLTRNFLRRSLGGKSDSNRLRSSLRRSLRFHSALTTSHEHLVRGAEPISNTVAMGSVNTDDVNSVI